MSYIQNCRVGKNLPIRHIYIHVPFCQSKCGYCSFYSQPFSKPNIEKYLKSLENEIGLFQKKYQILPHTIYFGGGTPSLLNPLEIANIIDKFDLSEVSEITLEINPISVTEKFVENLAKTKINRISMGVQSFDDDELKFLGRLHDSSQAKKAFQLLRSGGFNNISLDLIYGLPNQNRFSLIYSITQMLKLEPEHISTYCLSLEKDVPLFQYKNQIPPDEIVADFYKIIQQKLIAKGYQHYEISNFSKPKYQSKHNSCYWENSYYLGLGAGASGYLDMKRYNNNILKEYVQDISEQEIMANAENVSAEDHKKEYIFLGLRKADGINLSNYKATFKTDFLLEFAQILEKHKDFFCITPDRIYLETKAYFISNSIFAEFM